VDVRAVVERVWPVTEPDVEPLGGGITNHNFKVGVGGEAFVLRIGRKAVPGSAVEVEIFGESGPGQVAEEPLYDPKGERLRS
jgi:hypothetical protein